MEPFSLMYPKTKNLPLPFCFTVVLCGSYSSCSPLPVLHCSLFLSVEKLYRKVSIESSLFYLMDPKANDLPLLPIPSETAVSVLVYVVVGVFILLNSSNEVFLFALSGVLALIES